MTKQTNKKTSIHSRCNLGTAASAASVILGQNPEVNGDRRLGLYTSNQQQKLEIFAQVLVVGFCLFFVVQFIFFCFRGPGKHKVFRAQDDLKQRPFQYEP